MRRVTAVIAVWVVLVVGGCGGDAGAGAPPPASIPRNTVPAVTTTSTTTSTSAPPAVTPPTSATSPTSTSSPEPPRLPPEAPALLLASQDGLVVVAGGDVVVTFLEGVAVEYAVPDLSGGVVYQPVAEPGEWVWDDAAQRIACRPGEGEGIMRIAADTTEPVTLVGAEDGRPFVHRVFELAGEPTLLYSIALADPAVMCDSGLPECFWDAVTYHLVLHNLADGEETPLGVVAGFESSVVSFVPGPEIMVVITETYGEMDACGAVWQTADLLDAAGETVWLGEGGPFWRKCDFMAHPGPLGTLRAAPAPDGTTIAYAARGAGDPPATEFVVLDVASGEELRRMFLTDWIAEPGWLEWDGTSAVIGDLERTTTVLVLADGTVAELPAEAFASLWKETS